MQQNGDHMTEWLGMANVLLKIQTLLRQRTIEDRKQSEEIKKAVSTAFHNTEKYYKHLENGKSRDNQKEQDLARDWDIAGILVQAVDENLANRLALKSRFWQEGAIWTDQQIKDAGIQLARVRAEGMSLFGEKAKQK